MSASICRNGAEVHVPTFPGGRRPMVPVSMDGVEVGTLRRLRHGSWLAACVCGVDFTDVDPVSPLFSLLDHRQAVTHE